MTTKPDAPETAAKDRILIAGALAGESDLSPNQHLAEFLANNGYRLVVGVSGPVSGQFYSLADFVETGQPIPRGWPVQYLVEKRQSGNSPDRAKTRSEPATKNSA